MPFEPRNDFDYLLPPIDEGGLSAAAKWAESRDDSLRNSLTEARQNERDLADLIRQFDRERMVDAEGFIWEFLGRKMGQQAVVSNSLGFVVQAAGTEGSPTVTVYPSAITGLNASYLTPTLGGVELYAETPPELAVTANYWIYLRIEIEPVAVGGSAPYSISEDDFTVISTKIIQAEDDSSSESAAVDPDTGDVTNGVYLFPLAKIGADRLPAYQIIYGPIAASWCSGRVRIAPPVILHTGTVQSV